MKNLMSLFCLVCFICFSSTITAQEFASISEEKPVDFKKRSPIYDYSEKQLNNVDTIPDYASKKNKLKITGTIYESDGITPAKNVLLFIHQADEHGNFELKRHNKKRYVHHRGWIRTDADGHYTFYTFVPGKYIYGNELKQILPIVKEPGKPEYKIATYLFDDDPLLNDKRSKVKRADVSNRILKLDKKEGLYVAKRDIVLGKEVIDSYAE
ncbi:dioxygenase family protein [Flavivirga rizhaonensis]|uniref:Intradiol ring-cleavage dioxygenases domain-containing protein n=1 Tax=Flavivirga rizhaonensis TaxID=2559571 RepID=A0A4S1DU09_9FLAO|nr:hypothetical protein [Flavivirga rizhaonensis]TGV01541.1 hypothetical protein EM932_14770 [Flavivirga rizhaonensis]